MNRAVEGLTARPVAGPGALPAGGGARADRDPTAPAWSTLPAGARAFRLAHIGYGVVGMSSFGYLWWCAMARRRTRALQLAVGFLLVEGVALVIGRGNCPFGPFQRSLGDPVPMFELVLPPRAAKAAVPILAAGSLAGMVAVVLRPPRALRRRAPPPQRRAGACGAPR